MDVAPNDIGGYVLAGGKSSRMGQDKALLQLDGAPLVRYAVKKLSTVCADVHILSSRPELAQYAPLVADLHEGCGPMGGLQAAFMHSEHEWNLFLPVDMPFFPPALLYFGLAQWAETFRSSGLRAVLFTVDGIPQPLLSLLHRDLSPFIHAAMEQGNYKVFPVLEAAACELAARNGLLVSQVLRNHAWANPPSLSTIVASESDFWECISESQRASSSLWFSNLNTPEEFAYAENHLAALSI